MSHNIIHPIELPEQYDNENLWVSYISGIQKPAHVVTDTTTVKGIVNMTAVAVVQSMKGDLKEVLIKSGEI